jgi:hypothetical protein
MLISEEYRAANRHMHTEYPNYGVSGQKWAQYVEGLILSEGYQTVLDYGAGKQTLAQSLPHRIITGYDPAVAGLEADPEPAELVVCTDVLEHIEPQHINAVLRHLASKTTRKAFVNISLRPSMKSLPDGRNSHILLKDASWWRKKLLEHFRIVHWQYREQQALVFAELVPYRGPRYRKPGARRPFIPEWGTMISQIRENNHKYSDAWGRLNSFNMYEGVQDTRSDMQIVMHILEHTNDFEREIQDIIKLSAKAVLLFLPITRDFSEIYWKRFLGTHLRIGDWHTDVIGDGIHRLVMVGCPMVGVQGVTAVGAVASEDRWEQVKANSLQFPARIKAVPAHDRRAIIACYGPSLRNSLEDIRHEVKTTGATVISVSGSHDMLIAAGIVPTFHIECDPRPHKTDNLVAPHPDVEYLIASTVHPNYFDKLTGSNVRLWHVSTPEHATRIVDELGESSDGLISGGGSVGLRSIPLLYAMGYRDISIYAMDCSFEKDGGIIHQWAGRHAGKRQEVCEVQCADRTFLSSPVLMTYATGFFEAVKHVNDVTFRMYGDGLLQAMCRMYSTQVPQIQHVVEHV